jgi:DNA-binding SARP family transcriptional activator
VEFDVLGPLVVRRDGVPVTLGTPKQRALLILLVLQAGRVVSLSRLIEGLWAEDPPPHARVTLRSYVSNVRRSLEAPGEAPVIQTRGNGYVLDVPAEAIDARRFAQLARAGQEQLAAGDYERGLRTLDDALALWRGPALADVADDDFARGEIARLEESRAVCEEDRFDALLNLGRHAEAVAGLDAFIAEQPLRERAHAQLMLALYRSGRQADALTRYRDLHDRLVEELGSDPGPELRELHQRILRQDPGLEVATAEPERRRSPVSPHRPAWLRRLRARQP